MARRTLIAEWWEIRWRKGDEDVLTMRSSWAAHPGLGLPSEAYRELEQARAGMRARSNRYDVLVRVRRYRKCRRGRG